MIRRQASPRNATAQAKLARKSTELSPYATAFVAARAVPITVAHAHRLAALGLHPIILHGFDARGRCTCGAPDHRLRRDGDDEAAVKALKSAGKHPRSKGWTDAVFDLAQLEEQLIAHPESNLGIRMGLQPDGTYRAALDVDDVEAAKSVEAELGALPETLWTSSERGFHLIFEVSPEDFAKLSNFIARDGIDLILGGKQVVVGPSRHPFGVQYSTTIKPIAKLPTPWLERLATKPAPKAPKAPAALGNTPRDDRWLEHARKALKSVEPSVEGQHGGRHLFGVQCMLQRGWLLPRETADELLLEEGGWNDRCDPPWDLGDKAHREHWDRASKRADDASIESTIDWGSARPQCISASGVRHAEHPDERATPMQRSANDAGAAALAHVVSRTATARERGHDPAVDDLICHLAVPEVGVFQRSGSLVTITRDAVDDGGVIRPDGAPMIRTLTQPRLKEIVRMTAGPTHERLVGDVMARGEWEHIRPLDAIVTYPVLRRDGTVLTVDGYDAPTRTLASMSVHVDVPDAPTRDDARAAMGELLDLVSDFPFDGAAGRASWLAMLLTIPARPAINGPTPLGLLEASQRGSGKTLLADLISVITTGSEAPRRAACKTKEEWDKSLFSIALAGDSLVLIDNITTMLVSDSLDMLLTGTTMSQRVLGVSETRTVAVRTVFLASANNARLSTDLVRRSIACRLQPDVERPEQRSEFRYPDLLAHARAHRPRLIGAALTILRAYAVAGRPKVDARHMGSYESWCRVVRDAIVWAGAEDPATTQDNLRESADVERDEISGLLGAWHGLLNERAVTVRELLDSASTSDGTQRTQELYDALTALMPNGSQPTAHTVGMRLRSLRDQISGGLVLRAARGEGKAKVARWRVVGSQP